MKLSKVESIPSIGTDIEFAFVTKQHGFMSAADLIGKNLESLFGTDGADRLAEIRTKPAQSPWGLMKSTMESLKSGYNTHKNIRTIKWVGGGYINGYCIGTHLHTTLPSEKGLIKILDNVLAIFFLMLEDKDQAVSRRTVGYRGQTYGNLGDIRPKRGKHDGFEYRVPPCFLYSKAITLGLYVLWAAILDSYSNYKISRLPSVLQGDFSDQFSVCNRSFFMKIMPEIWKFISNLPYFYNGHMGSCYYSIMVQLYRNIMRNNIIDPLKRDIRITWNLVNRKEYNAPDIRKLTVREALGVQL